MPSQKLSEPPGVAASGDRAPAQTPGRQRADPQRDPPTFRLTALLLIVLLAAGISGCATRVDRDEPAAQGQSQPSAVTHDRPLVADTTSAASFCRAAAHFQIGEGERMSAAARERNLETMRDITTGPENLQNALAIVLETFKVQHVDGRAQLAGVRVGQFIEGTCPGVNIAGAR